MKKLYLVLTSIFSMIIVFSICYFLSNRNTKIEEPDEKWKSQESSYNTESDIKLEALNVATQDTIRISKDTKYTEEIYDIADESLRSNAIVIPEGYIGMTREELIGQLGKLSTEDITEEKGLVSATVTAFTKDSLIVRKTYDSRLIEYLYYICANNDMVTVYEKDKTTVFDSTGILIASLPRAQREQVIKGIYVSTEEELYGLLESLSS